MRRMMGLDLDKLRLGAHCIRRLPAVGCVGTKIRVLILGQLRPTLANGPRVRSLTFWSRYDLRLGIPTAALVT